MCCGDVGAQLTSGRRHRNFHMEIERRGVSTSGWRRRSRGSEVEARASVPISALLDMPLPGCEISIWKSRCGSPILSECPTRTLPTGLFLALKFPNGNRCFQVRCPRRAGFASAPMLEFVMPAHRLAACNRSWLAQLARRFQGTRRGANRRCDRSALQPRRLVGSRRMPARQVQYLLYFRLAFIRLLIAQ